MLSHVPCLSLREGGHFDTPSDKYVYFSYTSFLCVQHFDQHQRVLSVEESDSFSFDDWNSAVKTIYIPTEM